MGIAMKTTPPPRPPVTGLRAYSESVESMALIYGIEARAYFADTPWPEVEPVIRLIWERQHADALGVPWLMVARDVFAAWSYVPGPEDT